MGRSRRVTTLTRSPLSAREMLNKVPEVTLYFWIIKVLCTTVGETASDFLVECGPRAHDTTYITFALLLATLIVQFRPGATCRRSTGSASSSSASSAP